MLKMAQNKLILVKNAADHTTPANSTDWKTYPFTTASFTPEITKAEDKSVRPTRVEGAGRITKMTEGGSLEHEMSYSTFDDLIAAAWCNPWVANVLTSGGDVTQSFTAEETRGNLTANKFIPHLVFVETMSLDASYAGEEMSLKFGIKGGRPENAAGNIQGWNWNGRFCNSRY